ncbi:MAG: iron chaperone [Candidatus Acidiferrales bacterium]
MDEYIASQAKPVQAALKRVRSAIRQAVPGAEEVISYQIPAYKLGGGPVLYFAGWKQHYSLYPATAQVIGAFRNDLAAYKVSKSTIRFPLSEPVPVKLIGRIAKFRAKENAKRVKAEAFAKKR